jgi:hypothetical protein
MISARRGLPRTITSFMVGAILTGYWMMIGLWKLSTPGFAFYIKGALLVTSRRTSLRMLGFPGFPKVHQVVRNYYVRDSDPKSSKPWYVWFRDW